MNFAVNVKSCILVNEIQRERENELLLGRLVCREENESGANKYREL